MKKLIIYYNFIIVSFVVGAGFLSAQTPSQLLAAVLFFPLFIYFATRVIPRRNKAVHIPVAEKEISFEPTEDKKIVKLKQEGVDIDRRMFLKLIGSAGVALFVFSLFTKRSELPFFTKAATAPDTIGLKDSNGTSINPAEKQPTDGFKITELDDGDTVFYGFKRKDGAWFIMREDTSGSFRYILGTTNFPASWTNRTSLTYDYYDKVFSAL